MNISEYDYNHLMTKYKLFSVKFWYLHNAFFISFFLPLHLIAL